MNDPEKFLSRWARRKRDAARQPEIEEDAAGTPARESAPAAPEQESQATQQEPQATQNESKSPPPPTPESGKAAFDVSSLPSIESITGETDIRPFLAAGVPATLRRAALRRMWSLDPHVRGIVELAENTWDFNAPGVPGFDLSPPTGDVKRAVAELFGEKPTAGKDPSDESEKVEVTRDVHQNVSELRPREKSHDEVAPPEVGNEAQAVRFTESPEGDDDGAAAQGNPKSDSEKFAAVRRSHGSALPK